MQARIGTQAPGPVGHRLQPGAFSRLMVSMRQSPRIGMSACASGQVSSVLQQMHHMGQREPSAQESPPPILEPGPNLGLQDDPTTMSFRAPWGICVSLGSGQTAEHLKGDKQRLVQALEYSWGTLPGSRHWGRA